MSGLDKWAIRIAAAQEAFKRNRYSFIAAIVVSAALSIAVYNETLSYDRQLLAEIKCEGPVREACQTRRDALQKRFQEDIVISNSLLGIKFSGDDSFVLSPVIISIILMWCFYCRRRENHLVHGLLSDAASSGDVDIIHCVFFGLRDYAVFITISDDARPRSQLGEYETNASPSFPSKVANFVLALTGYLPLLALALIIVTHVISLWDAPLPERNCAKDHLYECLIDRREGSWVLWGGLFSVSWFFVAAVLTVQLDKFNVATRSALRDFHWKHIDKAPH